MPDMYDEPLEEMSNQQKAAILRLHHDGPKHKAIHDRQFL